MCRDGISSRVLLWLIHTWYQTGQYVAPHFVYLERNNAFHILFYFSISFTNPHTTAACCCYIFARSSPPPLVCVTTLRGRIAAGTPPPSLHYVRMYTYYRGGCQHFYRGRKKSSAFIYFLPSTLASIIRLFPVVIFRFLYNNTHHVCLCTLYSIARLSTSFPEVLLVQCWCSSIRGVLYPIHVDRYNISQGYNVYDDAFMHKNVDQPQQSTTTRCWCPEELGFSIWWYKQYQVVRVRVRGWVGSSPVP